MVGRVDIRKELPTGITPIRELLPRIIRELKALEPNALPIAMSAFPALAANIDVAISGKEVPIANKKKATSDSLMPNSIDMPRSEGMRNLAPR